MRRSSPSSAIMAITLALALVQIDIADALIADTRR
jgi:hypothetical protein